MQLESDSQVYEPASFDLVYLDAEKVKFSYEGENLTFTDSKGKHFPRVTLRRCFPLSAQNTYIMVCMPGEEDGSGEELGVVKDVEELDEVSAEAMMRELALHYFVPVIQKINSIREEFGFLYWSVETNRGKKEFIMRDSIIGAVRRVSEGRWLIIDINQTRYEIRDFSALDPKSQELLQRYLLL